MRVIKVLGCLVVLAALAVAGLGFWAWSSVHRRQPVPEAAAVVVEPGTSAAAVLADLERSGVIADARLARAYLVYGLGDPPIQAGEYRFEGELSAVEALDKLVSGDVVAERVTVVEGLTLEETADVLAEAGFGDREKLLAAMRDPAPIRDLDPEADDLEGYLFPDTYTFRSGVDERRVVAAMVENFRRRFEEVRPLLERRRGVATEPEAVAEADPESDARTADGAGDDGEGEEGAGDPAADVPAAATAADRAPDLPQRRPSRHRDLDLSVRELVTLASLVEKEARVPSERPVIAGVYANRLAAGMGLYADPTVIYALKRAGTWDGNITKRDLSIDSPYNTYRYRGLPPGPIASPGLASLRAAADPADVTYLYFVSRNDGTHVFADTMREHQANVERWQRRYWRERRARERAAAADAAAREPSSRP